MSRSGESVTRLDIRFPNEMYEKIQQIAVKDGARVHHISQKVEASPTVIKLVQFALDTLAGMISDNGEDVSASLSGMLKTKLSDNTVDVSDISDKRIESIVDKRLKELGLFPEPQAEDSSTAHSLPDKVDILPDSLPDSDVIISAKVPALPDSLPDTENTPSDDSSNSEPVLEPVPDIQADAIEQVIGDIPESLSWGDFHKLINLPTSTQNKANGTIAITVAKGKGLGDWMLNSTTRKFTKSHK